MTHDTRTTEERILAATIDILREEGESGLRIQVVAERAGLTSGAIYGAFVSREELIRRARLEWLGQWTRDEVEQRAQYVTNEVGEPIPAADYAALVTSLVTSDGRAARLSWAEASVDADRDPQLRRELNPIERRFLEDMTEQIRVRQREGLTRDDLDARAVACIRVGLSVGVAVTSRVFDEDPQFAARLVEAWQYLPQALSPDRRPPNIDDSQQ